MVYAAFCGFVLDLLLGDPSWMPHPVVYMGKLISLLEKALRAGLPKTQKGEFWGGVLLAAALPLLTLAVSGTACILAARMHPALGFGLQTLWCWQALAVKGLSSESRRVCEALENDDLPAARKAVGRIVGRDTDALDEAGVIRAAVETVAENFADGAAAPMLYMFLGGAPLALAYKAINTMDSMVVYKNDRYLYFGRAAARLDDIANYIPARIAAFFWMLSAGVTGQDAKGAYRIWRRDRRNHASPNSAQTEAACAGALGIQLGGPAYYFGERHEKPTIGDALRLPEPEDIRRANDMLYIASAALMAVCMLGGIWR